MSRASTSTLELVVRSRPDEASFAQTGQYARQQMDRIAASSARSGGGSGGAGGFSALNEAFGRRSEFTHALHAIEGTGALMGVGMLGRMLEEGTAKAAELRKQFAEGKISGGEMVDEIAKSVPLLGSFWSVGRNIRELLTGEGRAQEQFNQQIKEAAEYRQTEWETARKTADAYREMAKAAREAGNATANIYLQGPARSYAAAGQSAEARHADAPERLKRIIDEATSKHTADLAANKSRLSIVEKQLKDKQAALAAQESAAQNFRPGQGGIGPYVDDSLSGEVEALQTRRDQLQRIVAAQSHRNEVSKSRLTEGFNKSEAEQDKLAQEEQKKAEEDYTKEREKIAREAEERVGQVTAEARAQRMRIEGHGLDADLDALASGAKRQVDEIDQKLKEEIERIRRDTVFGGDDSPEIDKAIARAQAEKDALHAKYNADTASAGKSAGEAAMQSRQSLSRLYAEDLESALDTDSKLLENEKARLNVAEQFEQRQQQLKRIIADQYTDEQTRAKAQAELANLPGYQAMAQQGRLDKSFQDVGHGLLSRMAQGNPALERKLKQQQIEEQYKAYRDQLDAIANDPNASDDQVRDAQSGMDALPDAQKQEMARAMREGITSKYTADTMLNRGGRMSGAGMSAREAGETAMHAFGAQQSGPFDKVAKTMQDNKTESQKQTTLLERMVRALERQFGGDDDAPDSFLR